MSRTRINVIFALGCIAAAMMFAACSSPAPVSSRTPLPTIEPSMLTPAPLKTYTPATPTPTSTPTPFVTPTAVPTTAVPGSSAPTPAIPSPTPTPEPTVAVPLPTPAGPPPVPRPILNLDVVSVGREEMIVTTGVYSDGREVGEVAQAPGLVWAPDGVRFAYVAEDGKSVRVGNVEGDEKIVLVSDNEWYPMYQWPAWSPDGRRIAAINVAWCEVGMYVSSIEVIDAELGGSVARHGPYDFWQAAGTLEGPTRFSSPNKISWSRDGQRALISWDKAVVIDAVTGKPEVVTTKPVLAEWAPGSDAIYYFEVKRGEIRRNRTLGAFYAKKLGSDSPELIMDERRVSEMGLSNAWSPIPGALALSPSGGRLAMTGGGDSEGNSLLYVFDLTGGLQSSFESIPKKYEVMGHIAALDWAPDDGGVAALVSTDAGVSVDMLELATGDWTTVTTSEIELRQIEFLGKAISWSQ